MYRLLPIIIVALPYLTLAAPRTFGELANLAVSIINGGIGVALTLAIVIYFYGVATSIPKTSGGDLKAFRAHVQWGLVALFVMFSVWGILRLVSNTLFGGGEVDFNSGPDAVICESLDDCVIE